MSYSDSNGVKIYYEVSGEGFPFVMVHANPFDHNLWMYQIAHFSTYFKVIAIDIRGYGRSDKPETPFTLKDMADDVLAVCRDEGVKEAILGGVSVGSGMAILLGLDHPEMFKAIILVGGSSGPGGVHRRAHSRLHQNRHRKVSYPASARPGRAGFPRNQARQIFAQHLRRARSVALGRVHRTNFSRPRRPRHDAAARHHESTDPSDQRRIRQLTCRRQENRVADSRRGA